MSPYKAAASLLRGRPASRATLAALWGGVPCERTFDVLASQPTKLFEIPEAKPACRKKLHMPVI
jgi:hypothetical protein